MVDNLHDLCVKHVVYRLRYLIVVNQDQASLAHTEKITSGDHSHILAGLIKDREVAVTFF